MPSNRKDAQRIKRDAKKARKRLGAVSGLFGGLIGKAEKAKSKRKRMLDEI